MPLEALSYPAPRSTIASHAALVVARAACVYLWNHFVAAGFLQLRNSGSWAASATWCCRAFEMRIYIPPENTIAAAAIVLPNPAIVLLPRPSAAQLHHVLL